MSRLEDIERRHGQDRWRDLLLIGAALLMMALEVGVTTAGGVGKQVAQRWSVTVVDPSTQVEMP